MKTLYLIRHAKSSHNNALLPDIERPLNKRGKREATFMANILAEKNINPELFISSPAKRAFTTAELFAGRLNYKKEAILIEQVLYSFDAEQIISFIEESESKTDSLALFTHNPTVTDIVNFLSKENIFSMPTCAITAIQFNIDNWSDIGFQRGKIILKEYPELHRNELSDEDD